jgi:hypothetical protein
MSCLRPKKVIDYNDIVKYARRARRGQVCFYGMSDAHRNVIASMLEELLRHRDNEDRDFWGMDDE